MAASHTNGQDPAELTNLVLSRGRGESIVIAGGITVSVVEIARQKVRLSIRAPRRVTVHRLEVAERIAAEKRTQDQGQGGPQQVQDLDRSGEPPHADSG